MIPTDFNWWNVIFLAFGALLVFFALMGNRKLAKKLKSEGHNAIILKSFPWHIVGAPAVIYLLLDGGNNIGQITMIFTLVLIVSANVISVIKHQGKCYFFEDSTLNSVQSDDKIPFEIITEIEFQQDVVRIHTTKFINHFVVKKSKLRHPRWEELLNRISVLEAKIQKEAALDSDLLN